MSNTLTAPERETIINSNDEDGTVRIWSAQRTVITSLRKKPESFTEIAAGFYGPTEWAEFVIPIGDVNFGALAKRRGSPRPNAASNLRSRSLTVSTIEDEAA